VIVIWTVRPEQARFLKELSDEVLISQRKFEIASDAILLGGPPVGTVVDINAATGAITLEVPDAPPG